MSTSSSSLPPLPSPEKVPIKVGGTLLLVGVSGVVLAILGNYLELVSWTGFLFYLVYTGGLYLYFSYVNQQEDQEDNHGYGFSRFRSYLTFLPSRRESANDKVLELSHQKKEEHETELSLRISIQKEVVIDGILEEYVAPWYTKISSNTTFLKECRGILQQIFHQVGARLQQVNRNELAKETIQTVHLHWKEYCEATTKSSTSGGVDIIKCFKFVHPYIQDTIEVSSRCERTVLEILEKLSIPELQGSPILCHFLSGIMVKSFILYYTEIISEPSWINNSLILLLSSQTVLAELAGCSSQNSSAPTTPLPGDKEMSSMMMMRGGSKDNLCSSSSTSPAAPGDEQDSRFNFVKNNINGGGQGQGHGETGGIQSSVYSALGGVLPTTAYPLLPSGCCRVDNTKEQEPEVHELLGELGPEEGEVKDPESSSVPPLNVDNSRETTSKATTPTHYYSFEEGCIRKTSHHMLDTGTLSMDGALENEAKKNKVGGPGGTGSNIHKAKNRDVDEAIATSNATTRSPVYEEPEDFAQSIAKLRSLLEQKDQNQTTHKGGVDDLDNNEDYITSEMLEEGGGGFNKEPNEDDPRMNSVPELKCYFQNISIPKVEPYNDSTGGGQYDFYCIQYEGIYFDESISQLEADQPPKVILRTTTVKRRFKEFLLLQSKLEEEPGIKPHLKGIKAPNRWLNLSFSKNDAATTRKANLERYLNQLCSHHVLGTTREVMQFMAYGDDGFALGPMDLNALDPKHLLSTKLDKLAKKFTGVINSLKDVIPSFESNPPSPSPSPGVVQEEDGGEMEGSFTFNEVEGDKETVNPEVNNDDINMDIEGTQKGENLGEEVTTSGYSGVDEIGKEPFSMEPQTLPKLSNAAEGEEVPPEGIHDTTITPSSPITVNVSDTDTPPSPDETESTNILTTASTYPLASALTQLLCDVLWLPNSQPHNASLTTFMSLSGKSLENYVQETIDVFLSEEAILGYLEWLEKTIKDEEEKEGDGDAASTSTSQFDLCTELDLKNCLRKRIPAWVRWMWGRNRLDLTIDRITGFFQNPTINQDLILSLSELLLSKLNNDDD